MSSTKSQNTCSVCSEKIEFLNGVKSITACWRAGVEYHKTCWINFAKPQDLVCKTCDAKFPANEAAKYREHVLSAHVKEGEIADVKMYLPDGMINDANMDRVLFENSVLRQGRIDCLRICSEWLASLGVEYFISDGTLLGAFRENGKMISTDIDTDLSILEKDMKTLLENAHSLPEGYLLDPSTCNIDWSKQIDVPFDGKVHGAKKFTLLDVRDYSHVVQETLAPETDIYSFREDEEDKEILRNNYAKPNQIVHLCRWRKEWIFPLKEFEFEGVKVTGPNNPLAYLKELYGYIGHNAFWNHETKRYQKLPNTPSDPYE